MPSADKSEGKRGGKYNYSITALFVDKIMKDDRFLVVTSDLTRAGKRILILGSADLSI
jgi:hypothetical protein